jgi:hypothetical protein
MMLAAGASAVSVQASAPDARDAYLELVPASGAPAPGGTVSPGTKFTLDLILHAGTNNDLTAQQTYLTFNSAVLQVVDPNGTSCNAVSRVSGDTARFEAELQNETCNGPRNCDFRGATVAPGSIAFASGALSNPPVGGNFRVARITFCATNGGSTNLHFQFAPPDPVTRDTQVVNSNSDLVHNPQLFEDYPLTVTGATATPGPTNPPVPTPGGQCTMSFRDVPQSDPFYANIEYVYCNNIVTGYSDGTFKTYDYTMRAQIAKMVKLGFNLQTNTAGGPHFSDVPADHPFYEYIETIYNLDIVTGFDGGLFKPWDNVKRGQVAKIVVLAAMENDSANWQLVNPSTPSFRDVPRTDTFYQYVETARAHDMISGFNDGTFRLYDLAKRGQICKIIHGALTSP